MEPAAEILRMIADVLAVWGALSIASALALSAFFRAQARRDAEGIRAERRRVWLEAVR